MPQTRLVDIAAAQYNLQYRTSVTWRIVMLLLVMLVVTILSNIYYTYQPWFQFFTANAANIPVNTPSAWTFAIADFIPGLAPWLGFHNTWTPDFLNKVLLSLGPSNAASCNGPAQYCVITNNPWMLFGPVPGSSSPPSAAEWASSNNPWQYLIPSTSTIVSPPPGQYVGALATLWTEGLYGVAEEQEMSTSELMSFVFGAVPPQTPPCKPDIVGWILNSATAGLGTGIGGAMLAGSGATAAAEGAAAAAGGSALGPIGALVGFVVGTGISLGANYGKYMKCQS